ncbi:MAG: hypothetical protein FJ333_01055 [Sphingomonadales bacterium]|nr:hypothetical protein [Sphingomonadales bacterium]
MRHYGCHNPLFSFKPLLGVVCVMVVALLTDCVGEGSDEGLVHAETESLKQNDSSLIIDEFRSRFESEKYLCLIAYSSECPVAKNYIKTIKDLYEDYGNQVTFCLLDPGVGTKSISGMDSLLFRDPTHTVCKRYGLTVYPEVVLANCLTREILYQGKIDDRAVALGVVKHQAQNNYLKDAITQLLIDGEVRVENTQAVGCFIGGNQAKMKF